MNVNNVIIEPYLLTKRKRRISPQTLISHVEEEKVIKKSNQLEGEGDKGIASCDTFHKAIWPVLAIAQCFGIMPVIGIRSVSYNGLMFRWCTFRVLASMVYLIVGSFVALMFLRRLTIIGINAKNVVGFIFYVDCTFCGFLFLLLSKQWKMLMKMWTKHEIAFLSFPYKQNGLLLSTKIRLTAALFLSLALLEHLMYLSSATYSYLNKIQDCKWEFEDPWKEYFVTEFRHIFAILPYHFLLTLLIEWVNVSLTFAWNYMDLFIVLLSIGLTTRFKQINDRLSTISSFKKISESTWHEIRQHFVLLCELLDAVDKTMAALILLSCANNLYFICFQLLNIFNKLPNYISLLYFWYSLLFLIGRTSMVFMSAAAINDASKKPIDYIRQIPTSEWCTELDRFAEQVTSETVALSGMKFFYMTRKLLFGMAGTIVTYELVLLQFDDETKETGNINLCDKH